MNLEEYATLAMRTAKPLTSLREMLVHGAMGCCSEAGELAQTVCEHADTGVLDLENLTEELGDGVWYAVYMAEAAGASALVIQESAYFTHVVWGVDLAVRTLRWVSIGADIATDVKAFKFYDKPLDMRKLEYDLVRYISAAKQIAAAHSVDFSEVLEANVAKLRERYPDQYSDTAAIDRADKQGA